MLGTDIYIFYVSKVSCSPCVFGFFSLYLPLHMRYSIDSTLHTIDTQIPLLFFSISFDVNLSRIRTYSE